MLGGTIVNLKYFFYPIGNTPAVNVFHCRVPFPERKPQEEKVKILLLACGDPRSLLFTLWCKSEQGTIRMQTRITLTNPGVPDKHIKLSFICCDIEPAIIGI